MKRLFIGWIITLCLLMGATKPNPDPLGIMPVINAFRYDRTETTVTWAPCGQLNAYYQPWDRKVILCQELRVLPPAVIRYVLAHELAHGVIMQRGIYYTGSSEWAADELAAYVLILIGNKDDVTAGAEFWLGMSRPEDPTDSHLGDERRGYSLLCLVATHDTPVPFCDIQWRHVVATWNYLLEIND